MSERDDDRARIRAVLRAINEAWQAGRPDDVARRMEGCFHDKAVFRDADFHEVARGAEACVASYAAFAREATVLEATLGEPEIDLAGDAAVASYPWRVRYRLAGEEHEASGRDVFVLTQDEAARWFVRWRAILA